jgi:hypothetical protein
MQDGFGVKRMPTRRIFQTSCTGHENTYYYLTVKETGTEIAAAGIEPAECIPREENG